MHDAAVAAAVVAAQQAANAAVQQAVNTQNGQWASALDQLMSDLYPRVTTLEQSNAYLQQELQSARARQEMAERDSARWRARVEALEQYLPMFESRLEELSHDDYIRAADAESREKAAKHFAEAAAVEREAAAPVAAPAPVPEPEPAPAATPAPTPVAEDEARAAWFTKLADGLPSWPKKAGVMSVFPEREAADAREAADSREAVDSREAAGSREAVDSREAAAREAAAEAAKAAKAAADLDDEDCDVNPFLPKEASRGRSGASAAEEPTPTAELSADQAGPTEPTGEGANAGEAAGEEADAEDAEDAEVEKAEPDEEEKEAAEAEAAGIEVEAEARAAAESQETVETEAAAVPSADEAATAEEDHAAARRMVRLAQIRLRKVETARLSFKR